MSGTTAGTTSGTVLAYRYPQRRVMDIAFRKAGYVPEKISSEWIDLAQDALFRQLSEYINAGFPLWTRQFLRLPINIGSANVQMPYGTVDAFHVYWTTIMPWRGAATASTGGSVADLFAGQPSSDVTIAGPNPGAIVNFGSATEMDMIGVLLGGSTNLTAALQVKASDDGVTFVTVQTLPSTTFVPGTWSYFDLDPSITEQFIQIVSPGSGSWTLNQLNFCLANNTDVEIGPANIDDYYDLPNKAFQGSQANTAYVDRQRDSPVIKIWPTPNQGAFYNGTISALVRRYIQDPGTMTNSLEIPARWIEGVASRLGIRLMDELPEPEVPSPEMGALMLQSRMKRRENLDAAASKAELLMWSEERNRSPIRLTPNMRPYTA